MTTRRQSIAKPPMEDSYGRLHMNIDVREIKQVVNILHIYTFALLCNLNREWVSTSNNTTDVEVQMRFKVAVHTCDVL